MARGWNTETLKQHVDQRFADSERAVEVALASQDRRLDEMNELRAQSGHERGLYVTRGLHDSLESRIRGVENKQSSGDGRALGISAVAGLIITAVNLYIQYSRK